MGVIDIASSKSVWRGMEYYKQNKVLSYTVNEDGSCEGIVAGSGDGNYHVHVDMEHPRKSTCDCPLANGKKIICKHIVAVSLCLDESEADRFKNEKTIYASEEEERRAKKYEKYMGFARTMSPRKLRESPYHFGFTNEPLRNCYAPDTTEEVTESQFGVNSIKTMDSVQKSSEIRNFCTEFLLFAYLAKIKHFYKTQSPVFVFFSPILTF